MDDDKRKGEYRLLRIAPQSTARLKSRNHHNMSFFIFFQGMIAENSQNDNAGMTTRVLEVIVLWMLAIHIFDMIMYITIDPFSQRTRPGWPMQSSHAV